MITIQHQAKQLEIQVQITTAWLHQIGAVIHGLFDFSQLRAIDRYKEEVLHSTGVTLMRQN